MQVDEVTSRRVETFTWMSRRFSKVLKISKIFVGQFSVAQGELCHLHCNVTL